MSGFFSTRSSTPFIIRIFKKHIKEWAGSARDVIYADPITDAFDRIIIQPVRLASFSAGWKITAVYEAVSHDEMDRRTANLYRLLKGMECELVSEGLLKKRYSFKSLEQLKALRALFPDIILSDEIAKRLNMNEKLMKLLKSVRPDVLSVTLDSIPLDYKPFSDLEEAVLQGMISFLRNPEHIIWLVSVGRLFTRGLDTQKVADGVFYLLEEIVHNLRSMMKGYLIESNSAGEG